MEAEHIKLKLSVVSSCPSNVSPLRSALAGPDAKRDPQAARIHSKPARGYTFPTNVVGVMMKRNTRGNVGPFGETIHNVTVHSRRCNPNSDLRDARTALNRSL